MERLAYLAQQDHYVTLSSHQLLQTEHYFICAHHERIRTLIVELGPFSEVVQDARLMDVVKSCHIRHYFRVVRVSVSKALR